MSSSSDDVQKVARALHARLQHAKASGIEYVYPPASGDDLRLEEITMESAANALNIIQPEPIVETLDDIRADMGDCTRCKLHTMGRRNIVFGVGDPHARLMFVGEAPGADEDRKGEPFVGRAGQLLTRIIQAISLEREDVYIANILKSRPPKNRNPEPDEVAACEPFLKRQIAVIQPSVIVALGKFAAQTLAGTKTAISKMRGNWYVYEGIPLMPTFHPAYVLRNPNQGRRMVWEDMLKVVEEYNKDLPPGAKRAVPKKGGG